MTGRKAVTSYIVSGNFDQWKIRLCSHSLRLDDDFPMGKDSPQSCETQKLKTDKILHSDGESFGYARMCTSIRNDASYTCSDDEYFLSTSMDVVRSFPIAYSSGV